MSWPSWLVGSWADPWVVAKAAPIDAVAVLGLSVGHRRTLSQWTAIDFAAAVAIGGRSSAAPPWRRISRP